MNKSRRFVVTTALLLLIGTMPVYATVGGGDPPPQLTFASYSTVIVSTVLSVFGL